MTSSSSVGEGRTSTGARVWPGNVRVLENVIVRVVALSEGMLDEAALGTGPAAAESAGTFREQVEALERRLLSEALAAAGGKQYA